MKIIDKIAPLHKIKKKSEGSSDPWWDSELNLVKRQRDFLYTFATSSRKKSDWINYQEYNRKLNSLIRNKMIKFFEQKRMSDFKNTQLFYRFYHPSIKMKSDKSSSIVPECINNGQYETSDVSEMPNLFNSFFTTLSTGSLASSDECNSFINSQFRRLKRNKELAPGFFSFSEFSLKDVKDCIQNLTVSSSPGVSGIPIQILKGLGDKLSPILLQIFNNCLTSGLIPDEWKTALVTPLFKNKGKRNDMNNYRGISVLPPISKIFERLLASQISKYFEVNKIFFSGQHGFRKSFSCETALHELISDVNEIRDKKSIALLLFIDFKKAFDTVDSDLLISKLFHYGFDNNSLNLIRNYFINRSQIVKIGKNQSGIEKIKLGVPQGSVLGPLFFLIFINDLPMYLINLKSKLFADDTTIYFDRYDLDVLITEFSRNIRPLFEWCNLNRIDINWSKTYCMFITNKRVKIPESLILEGVKIEVVTKFRLLGVTLDSKLEFGSHVSEIRKLINYRLYSIKKLFYLSFSVKVQFFKTFILPYFDYCLSLIIYFHKSSIQRLANCYYLCLFKLFNFKFSSDDPVVVNEFLKKFRLFSFHQRIFLRLGLFSFRVFLFQNPPILAEQFKTNSVRNLPYELRNKDQLIVPTSERKFGETTFSYFFTKFINSFFLKQFNVNSTIFSFKNFLYENLNQMIIKFISMNERFGFVIKFFYF